VAKNHTDGAEYAQAGCPACSFGGSRFETPLNLELIHK
jgi:hypothetical protein